MRANQCLAKLRDLLGQAGKTLHERVALAAQAMADRDWIQEEHGGSDSAAVDHLASMFGDVCHGKNDLTRLLAVYGKAPEIEKWRARRFNVQVMVDEFCPVEKATRGERRTATLEELEEANDLVKDLEYKVMKTEGAAAESRTEVDRLTKQLADLTVAHNKLVEAHARLVEENAELRGRVSQMEKMFGDRVAV